MTNEAESNLGNTEQEALLSFVTGAAPTIMEKGMQPLVYQNEKRNPVPFGILDMLYQGVFTNTLGIMIGKDKNTGNEVPVIVGVIREEGGDTLIPIAVAIDAATAANFLPPDGNGGYIGDRIDGQ